VRHRKADSGAWQWCADNNGFPEKMAWRFYRQAILLPAFGFLSVVTMRRLERAGRGSLLPAACWTLLPGSDPLALARASLKKSSLFSWNSLHNISSPIL
jgi:hypothetical protein